VSARAAAVFEHRKRAALAGDVSALKRARLTALDGAGMTSAALAALADLSRETVRRAEAGAPISTRTRRRLAAALGRDLADLWP
jgi:DNA-binding XRE family transcriptional regulator